VVFKTGRP